MELTPKSADIVKTRRSRSDGRILVKIEYFTCRFLISKEPTKKGMLIIDQRNVNKRTNVRNVGILLYLN
jgi:hypothetical protein